MSEFYDDMRELTGELVTEFKQGTVIYTIMATGSGGTPDNPTLPTPVNCTINAVVRGVQFKYVQRDLALATDLQVTFASDAIVNGGSVVAPNMADFVTVNGVKYKIVQIIGKPAGEPVAYSLIVRK